MAEPTTENERIARRVPEDVATDGNLDLVGDLFTEDAVEHAPFGQEARGTEEIRESLGQWLEAFPDFSATVEDAITEGDTVAMRLTLRGTHEGDFMGMEPTNESFEIQNMVFTRIEDGKVAERWLHPDTLGMLHQLGIISPPGGMPAQP
ncbi:ester cyclase [Halosimplex salinum]|uniref:ester cyclase n=1 Tax=Halosimplex salinum TaxID=1710538 RepID=UPI000F46DB8E|nr:ester cyclase [Halosimplex salinum]